MRQVGPAPLDYTADHQPILGPGLTTDRAPIEGVTVASAGGHGMMWGPAVARIAADLALEGTSRVIDVSQLGLDRFDADGRSRLATDPIALPFPTDTAPTLPSPRGGGELPAPTLPSPRGGGNLR
jgi:sarcosine oxidase subunit beta